MNAPEQLLTLGEVAKLLHVSVRTVRRLIERGEIPEASYVTDGSPRWFPSDIVYYQSKIRRAAGKKPGIDEEK